MKTKYKNKGIMIIAVCLMIGAFTLGATGAARLVNPSAGEGQEEAGLGENRLVGVLVTREYLDLFDDEAYFNDNIGKLLSGGEISESEAARYQGRLYAALIAREGIAEGENAAEGADWETGHGEYVFEGVDGIAYFAACMTQGDAPYWTVGGDDAISDSSVHFASTDSGEGITLEGTIYVLSGVGNNAFYMNPVYQTPTGEVYAVSGSGMMFRGDNVPGMSSSQELKAGTAVRIGDEEKTFDAAVKITICFMEEPITVSVVQFDKNSKVISSAEYKPGKLPETVDTLPEAEYMVVETTLRSGDGTTHKTREMYQPGDESCGAFYTREDRICIWQTCEIAWGK